MAKYDYGGGCACGLYAECVCELAKQVKYAKEATADYKNDLQSALWDYGGIIEDLTKSVTNLQQVCNQWAEVSQRNYQRAKTYRAALAQIASNKYGLQAIQEDYDIDSPEYDRARADYYCSLVNTYQQIARKALSDETSSSR
jgi:hypothetical protein